MALPPLARRATIVASCIGVVKTKPCPIAANNVSPLTHDFPIAAFFHALLGIKPGLEPGISRSKFCPSPNRLAIIAILSIPTRLESS